MPLKFSRHEARPLSCIILTIPHSHQPFGTGIRIPFLLERELGSERQSNLSKDAQPVGEEQEESRINLTSAGRNNFYCKLMPLMTTSQTIPTQKIYSFSSCVAGGAVAPTGHLGRGVGEGEVAPT